MHIQAINPLAFRNDGRRSNHSVFYSCNTGTERNGTSFAQMWSNRTGGTTRAVVDGQTSYRRINRPPWYRPFSLLERLVKRLATDGYSLPWPAVLRPVAATGVKWNTFRPQESDY